MITPMIVAPSLRHSGAFRKDIRKGHDESLEAFVLFGKSGTKNEHLHLEVFRADDKGHGITYDPGIASRLTASIGDQVLFCPIIHGAETRAFL